MSCRYFFLTGCRSLGNGLLRYSRIGIHCTVTVLADDTAVEHTERRDSLDARICLDGLQRIAAASADAQRADAVFIYAGIKGNDIDHAVNIFDAVLWLIGMARIAAAGSLIGRVGSNGDIALFCQQLGVQAGDLFFRPAVRMGNDDGCIRFIGIVVRRRIYVGGNLNAVQVVCNGMNIDLSRHIFLNRSVIDETVLISLIFDDIFYRYVGKGLRLSVLFVKYGQMARADRRYGVCRRGVSRRKADAHSGRSQ